MLCGYRNRHTSRYCSRHFSSDRIREMMVRLELNVLMNSDSTGNRFVSTT